MTRIIIWKYREPRHIFLLCDLIPSYNFFSIYWTGKLYNSCETDCYIFSRAMMDSLDNIKNILFELSNNSEQNLQSLLQMQNGSKDPMFNSEEGNDRTLEEIILILAFGILMIISVFGNTLVCHVVFRNKRMHTVTNFFIANLAVSDLLLTLINVPFNLARNLLDEWPFGTVMCHLLTFSLMVSVYVSTFTLMGIALDRQQVLLYPLSPRMSKPVGMVVLALVWLLAIGLSLPFGMYNRVQTVDFFFKKVKRCSQAFPYPSEKWDLYLTVITFVLQYVIPLTIIAITYGRIVRKLWVRTHVGAVTANQQVSQQKAKRKSIKMLITVVVVFALCWMPLNVYQILADFHADHYNSTVFFICHWIAISSTCYNPFVYCWLNETFRAEVKNRFKCCFVRTKRIHPGTEIDGILLRSDRAYKRGRSKSFNTSTSTTKSSLVNGKNLDKYKVEIDANAREQSEFLTETSPTSETSMCVTSIGTSSLATVPEQPEVADFIPKGHAERESRETLKVNFMI